MPFKRQNPNSITPLTQWVSLFNNNDVNSIVRLYENDAVLIPTFELIIFGQKERAVYFTNLFKKQNIRCSVVYNEYKQFRGQVIEAITIICAGCGEEAFAPVAHDVIQVLLTIQNTQLEKRDAQRVYLLSAW